MNKSSNYIVAKAALWDSEKELFYCHIGLNKKDMPLVCTAWGKTSDAAVSQANSIIEALDNSPEEREAAEWKAIYADMKKNWDMGLLTKADWDKWQAEAKAKIINKQ